MSSRSTALWVVVGILLLVAAVPPLLVSTYTKVDPTLWGFPFYYWFQFALVPFAAVCTTAAYYVAKEAYRRDREARGPQTGGRR
jgi:membrane protein implicated in regulation of membrane protease activity